MAENENPDKEIENNKEDDDLIDADPETNLLKAKAAESSVRSQKA